ncbi:hypothetical protein OGAPHI_002925 [Ogataea philodendri]|uniref:Uncharacterized protein n=1 Tax=Ogataea philodendri TaxID=1378263 RepID=A0A9P8T5Z7_9ASCO|nr:uncharacterized protein OGAPHI_002925 [Ogataea philodendri]KAH3667276.1 hypothetical protein OGAPHI_002925 [Ogataea philodendri]
MPPTRPIGLGCGFSSPDNEAECQKWRVYSDSVSSASNNSSDDSCNNNTNDDHTDPEQDPLESSSLLGVIPGLEYVCVTSLKVVLSNCNVLVRVVEHDVLFENKLLQIAKQLVQLGSKSLSSLNFLVSGLDLLKNGHGLTLSVGHPNRVIKNLLVANRVNELGSLIVRSIWVHNLVLVDGLLLVGLVVLVFNLGQFGDGCSELRGQVLGLLLLVGVGPALFIQLLQFRLDGVLLQVGKGIIVVVDLSLERSHLFGSN